VSPPTFAFLYYLTFAALTLCLLSLLLLGLIWLASTAFWSSCYLASLRALWSFTLPRLEALGTSTSSGFNIAFTALRVLVQRYVMLAGVATDINTDLSK